MVLLVLWLYVNSNVWACQGQGVYRRIVCVDVSVCIWVHSCTLYEFNLSAVGPQHSAGPCRSLTFTELWERSGCPLLSASHLSLTEYDCGLYLLTMTGGQQVILRSSHAKLMLVEKVCATGFFLLLLRTISRSIHYSQRNKPICCCCLGERRIRQQLDGVMMGHNAKIKVHWNSAVHLLALTQGCICAKIVRCSGTSVQFSCWKMLYNAVHISISGTTRIFVVL